MYIFVDANMFEFGGSPHSESNNKSLKNAYHCSLKVLLLSILYLQKKKKKLKLMGILHTLQSFFGCIVK